MVQVRFHMITLLHHNPSTSSNRLDWNFVFPNDFSSLTHSKLQVISQLIVVTLKVAIHNLYEQEFDRRGSKDPAGNSRSSSLQHLRTPRNHPPFHPTRRHLPGRKRLQNMARSRHILDFDPGIYSTSRRTTQARRCKRRTTATRPSLLLLRPQTGMGHSLYQTNGEQRGRRHLAFRAQPTPLSARHRRWHADTPPLL